MTKKMCCCREDVPPPPIVVEPNWVAIPCKEYKSLNFEVGVHVPWQNAPTSPTTVSSTSNLNYPFAKIGRASNAPIVFDTRRQMYGMIRGGGGGGKGTDSVSDEVKGGNASYVESRNPAFKTFSFRIGGGGTGPYGLDVRPNTIYSGAMGYPLAGWGGSLSAMGSFVAELPTYISGAGGGGGSRTATHGGHGGILEGTSGESNSITLSSGGYPGSGPVGGISGLVGAGTPLTNPENGSLLKGGRGEIGSSITPIISTPRAGGGGGAGFGGGGGGYAGGGGGGGSSKYTGNNSNYIFDGTILGPGSRCNPYFERNYDAGLGAQQTGRFIQDCEVWESCTTGNTFSTTDDGADGEGAFYYRTKWCTCTETESEGQLVPYPNYICLTREQYDAIIAGMPTPTPPPNAGGDVLLSFVLNGERYLLLYMCTVGCESSYLLDGTPTDVKWYVQNLSHVWLADFPEWTLNEVTSCCDCYECLPICTTASAANNCTCNTSCVCPPSPPSPVISCAPQDGLAQYWVFDNDLINGTNWYYKCKAKNCWSDFYLDAGSDPFEYRIMNPNTTYEPDENPCPSGSVPCDPGCPYLLLECYPFKDQFGTNKSQAVQVSSGAKLCFVDPAKGSDCGFRCEPGTLERDRCQAFNYEHNQRVTKCDEQRFDCFNSSPFNCLYVAKEPEFIRYHYEDGEFYGCDECAAADEDTCCGGPDLDCPCGENIYSNPNTGWYEVSTCYRVRLPTFVPDAGMEPIEIKEYYDEEVLNVFIPGCIARNAGVNISDPEAIKNFIVGVPIEYFGTIENPCVTVNDLGFIQMSKVLINRVPPGKPINSSPIQYETQFLKICNMELTLFSCNSGYIAEKINASLNVANISATGSNPEFWFNWRVSCEGCFAGGEFCNSEGTSGVNIVPPVSIGDTICLDKNSVVYIPTTDKIRVTFRGKSLKYQACVAQIYNSFVYSPPQLGTQDTQTGSMVVAARSLLPLSPAQYSKGLRYTMVAPSEDGVFRSFCEFSEFATFDPQACATIVTQLSQSRYLTDCFDYLNLGNTKCKCYQKDCVVPLDCNDGYDPTVCYGYGYVVDCVSEAKPVIVN